MLLLNTTISIDQRGRILFTGVAAGRKKRVRPPGEYRKKRRTRDGRIRISRRNSSSFSTVLWWVPTEAFHSPCSTRDSTAASGTPPIGARFRPENATAAETRKKKTSWKNKRSFARRVRSTEDNGSYNTSRDKSSKHNRYYICILYPRRLSYGFRSRVIIVGVYKIRTRTERLIQSSHAENAIETIVRPPRKCRFCPVRFSPYTSRTSRDRKSGIGLRPPRRRLFRFGFGADG